MQRFIVHGTWTAREIEIGNDYEHERSELSLFIAIGSISMTFRMHNWCRPRRWQFVARISSGAMQPMQCSSPQRPFGKIPSSRAHCTRLGQCCVLTRVAASCQVGFPWKTKSDNANKYATDKRRTQADNTVRDGSRVEGWARISMKSLFHIRTCSQINAQSSPLLRFIFRRLETNARHRVRVKSICLSHYVLRKFSYV